MLTRLAALIVTTLICAGAHADGPPVRFSLDHVALQVKDLARSAAFYKEVLGLKEIPAQYPGIRWLAVGDGQAIHLLPGRVRKVTDQESHLALATTDLAPVIAALNARHVAWTDGNGKTGVVSHARADGVGQIYIEDPDGYVVEINDGARATLR
jgi:lactoylglutathione lyase